MLGKAASVIFSFAKRGLLNDIRISGMKRAFSSNMSDLGDEEPNTASKKSLDKEIESRKTEEASLTHTEAATNGPPDVLSKKQGGRSVDVKETKPCFQLVEKTGDLFTCPATDSLAHCISADVRMGAGIAVQFRKRFGNIPAIKRQNKGPGEVAVLEKDGRFIYNLVTKVRYNHKPTYGTLRGSLEDMKKHCTSKEVSHISMPRIGSGLDKLQWSQVKTMLKEVFEDTNVTITVYAL